MLITLFTTGNLLRLRDAIESSTRDKKKGSLTSLDVGRQTVMQLSETVHRQRVINRDHLHSSIDDFPQSCHTLAKCYYDVIQFAKFPASVGHAPGVARWYWWMDGNGLRVAHIQAFAPKRFCFRKRKTDDIYYSTLRFPFARMFTRPSPTM